MKKIFSIFRIKKNGQAYKVSTLLFIFAFLSGIFTSCKKDVLKSKYASLLQHKWNLKSTTSGSTTTQFASGIYREYKSDGTWIASSPGFSYTGTYELMLDSVLLSLNPATINTSYSPPDTSFIRQINESLFISYRRKFFISPNYSTMEETVDTLIR